MPTLSQLSEVMVVEVCRDDVIAFRLHAQNLTERLDDGDLSGAAGACGVQNSHLNQESSMTIIDPTGLVDTVSFRGAMGAVATPVSVAPHSTNSHTA